MHSADCKPLLNSFVVDAELRFRLRLKVLELLKWLYHVRPLDLLHRLLYSCRNNLCLAIIELPLSDLAKLQLFVELLNLLFLDQVLVSGHSDARQVAVPDEQTHQCYAFQHFHQQRWVRQCFVELLKTVSCLWIHIREGLKLSVVRTERYIDGKQAVHKVHATEHYEAPIVARPYAVVEPGAVMIEPFDTLVARSAVLGTRVHLLLTQSALEDLEPCAMLSF